MNRCAKNNITIARGLAGVCTHLIWSTTTAILRLSNEPPRALAISDLGASARAHGLHCASFAPRNLSKRHGCGLLELTRRCFVFFRRNGLDRTRNEKAAPTTTSAKLSEISRKLNYILSLIIFACPVLLQLVHNNVYPIRPVLYSYWLEALYFNLTSHT